MQRRMVLAGTGIALSTFLGGCLSNNSILTDDEGSDNESSTNESEFEYDTFQAGALRATHNPLNGATASLDVFTTSNDASEELPLDDIDTELRFDDLAEGQEGGVEDFIEKTDYNNNYLVSVVTQWPKSNPSGIEILELDRYDDKITGAAEATGEDPDVGDDAPTFPITLIRVTAGDDRPSSVEMTISDGSGNEATIDT
ncbi:hypothetical protein AB7C87_23615 [Natrarchaeobius sp. A-rgal3]|uniref:hypothetical protein n=1 Tax=Natrarchaeobius versutus TaxID=1679078 RepID=UPI00350F678F